MTSLAIWLLALAAVVWCIGPLAFYLFERSQGMDTPEQTQARMDEQAARCDAHWKAVEDAADHARKAIAPWDGKTERRTYRARRKVA